MQHAVSNVQRAPVIALESFIIHHPSSIAIAIAIAIIFSDLCTLHLSVSHQHGNHSLRPVP
jgi:hypothetical protein